MAERPQENSTDLSFDPPASILIIDDSDLNRRMIRSLFEPLNFIIFEMTNGKEGFELAKEKKPEIILLDIMMPGNDGYETCAWLKEEKSTRNIPVIFITALDSVQEKIKGFEVGAIDFVTKPFNYREVIARVRTHISLSRASAEREKMLSVALEQKRNAVIARIAAGVSHNFSNLLSVSVGNLMFVESLMPSDIQPEIKNALSDLNKSLQKQKLLVRQFLRVADRGAIESSIPSPESLNLRKLVDEVIENTKIQGEKKALRTVIDNQIADDIEVFCDPAHIREIFYLLFHEVIEGSTDGKILLQSLPREGQDRQRLLFHIEGLPCDPSIGKSIFEPYALPIANVGTGLAFSVSKTLVEKNKGCVEVAFPAPRKITLTFELPTAFVGRCPQKQ